MKRGLTLQDFRLSAKSSALALELEPGQWLGVYGPSGSGKSRFIQALAGLGPAHEGSIRLGGRAVLAGHPEASRRATPEFLARKSGGPSEASRAAEALAATGLWNVRKKAVGNLSPGQQAAAELLEVLTTSHPILLVDGQLDRVDPWVRESSLGLLRQRRKQGACLVSVTGLAELMPRMDCMIVWQDGRPIFSGSLGTLEREYGVTEFELETVDEAGVRALCEPFEVQIEASGDRMRLAAAEGQGVASSLLLEGYGDIRAIVRRRPTPAELLGRLL